MMRAMHFPLLRVALILLSAATPAIALSATSVRLEDLTPVELRDAIGAGTTTILVPIGGTEQTART